MSDKKALDAIHHVGNVMLARELPDIYAKLVARAEAGGLWHPCYGCKLTELDRWCRDNVKTNLVYELGSGLSSHVLARWSLHDTIDIDQWMENVGQDLHVAHEVIHHDGNCYYDSTPSIRGKTIDLLYVDGPSEKAPDGTKSVGIDANVICGNNVVRNVLFDMRLSSVKAFKGEFEDRYEIIPGNSFCGSKVGPPVGYRHHTWARLK